MSGKDRTALKELIKNILSGPWTWETRNPYSQWIISASGHEIALTLSEDTAKYFAAVSPDAVAGLINDYEDKAEALQGIFYMVEDMRKAMGMPKNTPLQEIMQAINNIVINALKEAGAVK